MSVEIKVKKQEYNDDSIISLGLIEGIKKRPSTFIEDLGPKGIMKLAFETVQNANDEVSNGNSNKILVIINSTIPEITVQDWGRGIPLGKLETILEEIYSGGKYNEDAYAVHNGANGMGLMITNVLSEYFKLEIYRDNKKADVLYKGGYKQHIKIEDHKNTFTGTKVTFKPNLDVFFGPNSGYVDTGKYLNKNEFIDTFDILSFLNPGVTVELIYDGERHTFYFKGTPEDYLFNLAKRNKIKTLWDSACVFDAYDPIKNMKCSVALTFGRDINSERNWSYVNRFPTPDNGKHVDGVRAGVSRVVTQFIKDGDYVPKSSKFTVSGSDITDNIVDIVMAEMPNPLFDGQTKNKLTSEDFFNFAATQTYKYFSAWGNTHRDEMDKLCKLAVLKAKASFAAKEARQQALNPTSVKNIVTSKLNFKNFTDCSGNNPEENELYICEGLSASSSLVLSRDSKTQAYLALRGKPLNVTGKKNPKLTEELQVLASVLGIVGIGDAADYRKLRYHNIIIMSDSDPDGSHIASLLLGFFLVYYPKLISDGHIFIATPPFYQLVYNKKHHLNILNDSYFHIYKKEIAMRTMELIDINDKVIDKRVFSVFLDKLIGYNEFLEAYGKELNLDYDLLELVIRSFDDLIKEKYKQFEHFGYKVQCKTKNKSYRMYYFDKEYNHYNIKIDNVFYSDIYVPVYKKICEIKLGNVRLRNIKTKEIYGGTLYNMSNCIDSLLVGKRTILKRFKGIGELDSDLLRETAMDPKTRKIIRVTMNNIGDAKKWAGILLGDDDPATKKNLFSA